ncbi:hypothetical protein EGJ54_24755 [Pandoraea apista]|nr:hypothetical protein EGJ54_24755 [Pandoraea apista]
MLSARDASNQKITTDDRARGLGVEPFTCDDCGVGVSHVQTHPKERDGMPYLVKAYFRLKPKTEHKEGCAYSVDKKVEAIAARSDGLVESIRKGKFRFRLLAIDREPEILTDARPASRPRRQDSEKAVSTEYAESKERRLASYLSTAKRILQLRAACESDESIKDHLQLVFSGDVIHWPDFYYEPERFLSAYSWLGNVANSFPIVLQGQVRNVVARSTEKGQFHVLNLKSVKAVALADDETIGESASASVWAREGSWLERYSENDEILAFGHWKRARKQPGVRTPKSIAAFRAYQNREMSMWLVFPGQLAKLTDAD